MTTANNLASLGSTGVTTGFKNRIINGAMQIDQRNAGASVTPTNGQYTVDRWNFYVAQASKLTVQQQTASPPVGFTSYVTATSSSAYSITSSDYFLMQQGIEGFNIGDLGWGTANAKAATLSFWVRSSLTGTFGGVLQTPSNTMQYVFSYTITAANTWQYVTITVPGPTTGTFNLGTNLGGVYIVFGLATGSTYVGSLTGAWSTANTNARNVSGAVSLVGTSGATWSITGVQLEVGTTATNFDYRSYGTELALCQRYYQRHLPMNGGGVGNGGSTMARAKSPMFVPMRTYPSIGLVGSQPVWNGASAQTVTTLNASYSTPTVAEADLNLSGTYSVGQYLSPYSNVSSGGGTATAGIELSAEL